MPEKPNPCKSCEQLKVELKSVTSKLADVCKILEENNPNMEPGYVAEVRDVLGLKQSGQKKAGAREIAAYKKKQAEDAARAANEKAK